MLMSDEREALTPYPGPLESGALQARSATGPDRRSAPDCEPAPRATCRPSSSRSFGSSWPFAGCGCARCRRAIRLGWSRRRERAGSIVLDVPTSDPRIQAVLEASTDPRAHARRRRSRSARRGGAARRPGARSQSREAAVAPPASRRRGAAHRVERGHGGAAPARRARRDDRLHRADRRRERHGQGAGGASDPRAEPPAARTVRGRQLRSGGRDAARGRALRHRGSHGHGRARPPRQVRALRHGHAVPGRSVGPVAFGAGQAPARGAGPGRGARGRHRDQAGEHAHRRRDQPAALGDGRARVSSAPTCTTG